MKKTVILLLSIVIGLCVIGVSFAVESDGNERKGKYVYRQECRQCHKADSEAGAPNLSPDSKTMAQWESAFEKENYSELECAKEWDKRSEEELNDIFTYLHKYAADSPTPAKCL
ncbi:MAG: cytochrome c [Deltaproteobacteria bacterium]|nr:cytochrome c [Deltaproteobacteria bacterium]